MWGASVPSIYYGFYCDPQLQLFHWSLVRNPFYHSATSVRLIRVGKMSVVAVMCMVVTLSSGFSHPQYRPYRAALYTALGLTAVLFVPHGIWVNGLRMQKDRMSLDWMALVAVLNTIGAGVYAARVSLNVYSESPC